MTLKRGARELAAALLGSPGPDRVRPGGPAPSRNTVVLGLEHDAPDHRVAAIVLKELDQKKTKPGSLGKRATKAIQEIDELFDEGGKTLPIRLLPPSDDRSLSQRGLNGLI